MPKQLFFVLLACLCVLLVLNSPELEAQTSAAPVNAESVAETQEDNGGSNLKRLEFVQNVLSQKLLERSALGERIEAANEQDKNDLRRQADDITHDIRQLRTTLESIAIGDADSSLFTTPEETEESNWRTDVTLIAQPVIDSLKELTEKPRRIKALNDAIALHALESEAASTALENMSALLNPLPDGDLGRTLTRLAKVWEGRGDDALSAIEIAQFQIADLQGDKSFAETVFDGLRNFITGRGLTIALAVLAACIVWFGVRFMLRGYRATLNDHNGAQSKTRYRLAAYSVQALTFILILIAVFVVFYQRGDVLLLGVLILLIVGLALGVRHLLPRYISEARLLLNIGAMRESERIIYKGLPWRVESINMYTVLRNPELHGVLRIPLAEFHGITSRPSGKDEWFPTSRGDTVLLADDTWANVIDQNPDNVCLAFRGGEQRSMPTTEFYKIALTNLSRGDTFGVTSTFGIDYKHQDISLIKVPKILRDAIRNALANTDLAEFVKDIKVELQKANTSSLDYWLFVTCESRAAKSYSRIQRAIQSACVEACTAENISIPFPHISVVRKAES